MVIGEKAGSSRVTSRPPRNRARLWAREAAPVAGLAGSPVTLAPAQLWRRRIGCCPRLLA